MLDLLGLFEGIAPAELPIADLTKFLLTSDDNDDCWLLTSDQQDVWDKVIEFLVEDADRIPAEPVIEALQHALEVVSDSEEESDSDTDTCLEQLASFATVLPTFPADVLAALLAHQRAFVRMIGLDTLNELNREAEIVPYPARPGPRGADPGTPAVLEICAPGDDAGAGTGRPGRRGPRDGREGHRLCPAVRPGAWRRGA